MADDPERAGAAGADELYGVPLEEFTAARDALARHLRSENRRDEAAAIAKLRRPPATAWALNQVARGRPSLVERMLAAGQELRAATEEAMRGDASGLRAAQARERDAVNAAVDAAVERLKAVGRKPSDAVMRRLAGTLRAAIMDGDVAGRLRAGVLDADHETSGLGLPGLEAGAVAPRRRPPAQRQADREEAAQHRAARARRTELEAEAERLERRAERLDETARNAEARAAKARTEADEARRAAAQARRRLEEDEE